MNKNQLLDVNGDIFRDFPLVTANKQLAQQLLSALRLTTRILIVVDGEIALEPGEGFGISRLIDFLRAPSRRTLPLFQRFDVTLARRGLGGNPVYNPRAQPYEPTYENFSFDMDNFQLDAFDQVWLFGWWEEDYPAVLSQAEIDILSAWMDDGGGVFATGDHGTRGAALCKNVPRVRFMRRWTSSQNPPPFTGRRRHDTTQLSRDAQDGGRRDIPFTNERDDTPQPIIDSYTRVLRSDVDEHGNFFSVSTVHPLLCGIGSPVAVLPDHPHEGEVIEVVNVDAVDPDQVEFPSVNGQRPKPQWVAKVRSGPPAGYHGSRLIYEGDLDSNGNVDFTRAVLGRDFVAIGAYNGHEADVGRVVVDSSLHHWLNLNLQGLGPDDLRQVERYYLNVATWLGKREHRIQLMAGAILTAMLVYPGIGEMHVQAHKLPEAGHTLGKRLRLNVPNCEVIEYLMDDPKEVPTLDEREPERVGEECLSCPPWSELEAYMLGGIAESLREIIVGYEVRQDFDGFDAAMVQAEVETALISGIAMGRRRFANDLRSSLTVAADLANRVEQLTKSGDRPDQST